MSILVGIDFNKTGLAMCTGTRERLEVKGKVWPFLG